MFLGDKLRRAGSRLGATATNQGQGGIYIPYVPDLTPPGEPVDRRGQRSGQPPAAFPTGAPSGGTTPAPQGGTSPLPLNLAPLAGLAKQLVPSQGAGASQGAPACPPGSVQPSSAGFSFGGAQASITCPAGYVAQNGCCVPQAAPQGGPLTGSGGAACPPGAVAPAASFGFGGTKSVSCPAGYRNEGGCCVPEAAPQAGPQVPFLPGLTPHVQLPGGPLSPPSGGYRRPPQGGTTAPPPAPVPGAPQVPVVPGQPATPGAPQTPGSPASPTSPTSPTSPGGGYRRPPSALVPGAAAPTSPGGATGPGGAAPSSALLIGGLALLGVGVVMAASASPGGGQSRGRNSNRSNRSRASSRRGRR